MRCKAGDLAVIVRSGSSGSTRNLGRLVRVVERAPSGLWFDPFLGKMMRCSGGSRWIVESLSGVLECRGHKSMFGTVHDERLRPIRPDADPVETETDIEVAA